MPFWLWTDVIILECNLHTYICIRRAIVKLSIYAFHRLRTRNTVLNNYVTYTLLSLTPFNAYQPFFLLLHKSVSIWSVNRVFTCDSSVLHNSLQYSANTPFHALHNVIVSTENRCVWKRYTTETKLLKRKRNVTTCMIHYKRNNIKLENKKSLKWSGNKLLQNLHSLMYICCAVQSDIIINRNYITCLTYLQFKDMNNLKPLHIL